LLDSKVALAEMLVNGRGGKRDHQAALVLFEGAANEGHIGAMFATGALYGGGHDIAPDRIVAQKWFQMAAERGHAYAQMMLGRYLARGLAGEQNIPAARQWLESARSQGVAEVAGDLAALPPEQPAPSEAASAAG
jgi:TPR repeat protein